MIPPNCRPDGRERPPESSNLGDRLRAAKAAVGKLPTNPLWPYLLTALAGLLIVLRNTRYFTEPRFWAEEGSYHFAFSYSHDWWRALFQPQQGYLNFWPNLATLLSTLPPLELAPLVTTLMALVVQLLPVAIIAWSRSPIWGHWARRLAGIGVTLFSALTAEVWLNTVNSYNYFAAITFLLLLEHAPLRSQTARRWAYRTLLLTAGLTGLNSTLLMPFFALRAVLDRQAERWRQVAILSGCAVVHLVVLVSVTSRATIHDRSIHPLGLAHFGAAIWTQTIGLFTLGYEGILDVFSNISSLMDHDPTGFQRLGWSLLVLGLAAMFVLSVRLPLTLRVLFIGSYLVLMFIPMTFSIITDKPSLLLPGDHQRLFLTPNLIFGWMLVAGSAVPRRGGWRVQAKHAAALLGMLLLSASVVHGVLSYRYQFKHVDPDHWPNWTAEVENWRADSSYMPRIQPEGWVVPLEPP